MTDRRGTSRIRDVMQDKNAVPYSFCIWDSFPSAYSGKRDIGYIKKKIENLIEIKMQEE